MLGLEGDEIFAIAVVACGGDCDVAFTLDDAANCLGIKFVLVVAADAATSIGDIALDPGKEKRGREAKREPDEAVVGCSAAVPEENAVVMAGATLLFCELGNWTGQGVWA
ncbi:unnamed protein product [Protopolystoma xenopodis]|uniref:Uncharacterized protein n=1 Tax=Protopolystoma xenopodis TaxID=117903 RepID=A0A448WWN3_9PLAT|nr:unnamed protein product [Protopolystoma xenopodis]